MRLTSLNFAQDFSVGYILVYLIDQYQNHLADTFIVNHENVKLHARYAAATNATPRTAIIIHGYKMNSLAMLHIAYLFHHDLHYNILLPDLQSHGLSGGDEILEI